MTPLRRITGMATSLPQDDVDTDIIYPARFLLITEKKGLGRYAFADRRHDAGFPFGNDDRQAPPILVAGRNFGCGSSREHAVWALAGLGLSAIIAPGFGEIFESNCFKNGVLAIRLSESDCALAHAAATAEETFDIDLERETLAAPGLGTRVLHVREDRRQALLNGWNEIGRIRALFGDHIAAFEAGQRNSAPWLWTEER